MPAKCLVPACLALFALGGCAPRGAGPDAHTLPRASRRTSRDDELAAALASPYTAAELKVLIQGAILARLYQASVKPARLFGELPHALPDQTQSDLMETDLFQGGANCDFDTRRMCVTFRGEPYRETTDSWILERVSPWAGAYEQPDGVAVRALDTSALAPPAPPASPKGSTTFLYREAWPPGSGIATRPRTAAEVGGLLVHEQAHTLHILKHPTMLDYEMQVYMPPGSNWSKLHRALRDEPLRIVPYMQNDRYDPLANQFGLPSNPDKWSPAQVAAFRRVMRRPRQLSYWAYRYLPTEVQAFDLEYRARRFFARPRVKALMRRRFDEYWADVIGRH